MNAQQLRTMLFGVPRALTHAFRYSTVPVLRRESVAEHSFWVSFYSWTMARLIQQAHPHIVLDMASVLEQAIVHDCDEAVTGDFLRGVKYRLPGLKELLDKVAQLGMAEIDEELGVGLKDAWSAAKGPGAEGAIVRTADFLGVVAYMSEESAMGNHVLALRADDSAAYLAAWRDELDTYPDVPLEVRQFLQVALDEATLVMRELSRAIAKEQGPAQLFSGLARLSTSRGQ